LNARRIVIERAFAEAGLKLNLAAEAVTVASELSAVRSGAAATILNLGNMSGFSVQDFAEPVLIEPTFYMTCSILWSNDHSLPMAADRARDMLIASLKQHIDQRERPGANWID
jgi:LysR family transcriptional regulator, nitrogen assimilation regulatory protein